VTTVALSADFLEAFARLPKHVQKKTHQFLEKFRRDPGQGSIHYEKIHDVVDDKVRTVRIGDDYRAIVIHPPSGDVYLCVWIDHHDEAMQWARSKSFEVHPGSGALQVIDTRVVEQTLQVPNGPANWQTSEPEVTGLFAHVSDEELGLCGAPEPLIPALRAVKNEDELEKLLPILPGELSDTLLGLAAGWTVEKAISQAAAAQTAKVDPKDFEAALRHPDSQRRFAVLHSEAELESMLRAPLEKWRIFLHPSQRRIVEIKAKGPVRVLGGAGTGKTVVAMHRARCLAARFTEPGDRVLFTTYTRNLAADILRNLQNLCTSEELERIEVTNLHAWSVRRLQELGRPFAAVMGDEAERLWEAATAGAPFTTAFYREEWDKVVQANDITTLEGYLGASRIGRGTPLTRAQRAEVWKVFLRYRTGLDQLGKQEFADAVREARLSVDADAGFRRYRAVIADEVQDFRNADLRLLRTLAAPGPDDLFLVGDAHQRIYGHRASLRTAGIDVRGRGHRLKLNYRTTEQIRDFAVRVLEGTPADDLDDGKDDLEGYRSLRLGDEPEVHCFQSANEEKEFLVERVRGWLESGSRPSEICVAARTKGLVTSHRKALEAAGIPVVVLDPKKDTDPGPGVRLATMHRVKGLEFPRVLIASVQDGVLPLLPKDAADAAALEDVEWQEKRLLFVAMTRARDELVLTGHGKRCRWIPGSPSK
jgi:mRNA-degrading endonuclease RelE of RelBE toxin-antitoxin system